MEYTSKRTLPGGVNAQIAGDHIESVRKKKGIVTPDILVKSAKAKLSPIHNCFTWDDKEAGNLRRLDEAKYILRMITIEVETDDEPVVTRAFVSVVKEDERQYATLSMVMSDDDLRGQLLEQAKRDMWIFRQKYSQLKELAQIFRVMDEMG